MTVGEAAALTSLPISRVKKIMKEDQEVHKIANDAAICTAVATEVFLQYLIKHAHQYTRRDNRKTVSYKDLALAVKEVEQLDLFLQDVIPQPVKIPRALKDRQELLEKRGGSPTTQNTAE
jgi:histone H3/H4